MDCIISFIIMEYPKSTAFLVNYKSGSIRKMNLETFLEEMCRAHQHNYVYKKVPLDLIKKAETITESMTTCELAKLYFAINTMTDAPKTLNGPMLMGVYDYLWDSIK